MGLSESNELAKTHTGKKQWFFILLLWNINMAHGKVVYLQCIIHCDNIRRTPKKAQLYLVALVAQ